MLLLVMEIHNCNEFTSSQACCIELNSTVLVGGHMVYLSNPYWGCLDLNEKAGLVGTLIWSFLEVYLAPPS